MTVFGTIGIFVRYIHLPSSIIALVRGIIGAAFLLGAVGAVLVLGSTLVSELPEGKLFVNN